MFPLRSGFQKIPIRSGFSKFHFEVEGKNTKNRPLRSEILKSGESEGKVKCQMWSFFIHFFREKHFHF
jgi:hypothetical protein